jgi:hypothetical protein
MTTGTDISALYREFTDAVRRSMRPMKVRSLFLQDVVEMDIATTFRVQLRTVMAQ